MNTDANGHTTSALQHLSPDEPLNPQHGAQAELDGPQAQQEHLQPAATAEQAEVPNDIALQPPKAADAALAGSELHKPGSLQVGQSPATPAVRTLDDIMSEYESPKHHHLGPELPVHPPPAAPAQPSLHSTEHATAQGEPGSPADQVSGQGQAEAAVAAQDAADEAVGAHAVGVGHDEHMPDASPTGLQHGLPAETPGMAPLPGKVRCCSSWNLGCYACANLQHHIRHLTLLLRQEQEFEVCAHTASCPHMKESTIGGAARRQEIKPESDAGSVIWAKTKGYPWWPAQVLPVPGLRALADCASKDASSSSALCNRASCSPLHASICNCNHPWKAHSLGNCTDSPCSILQVLAVDDPWIPPDMEIPRRGAVPVRFFGTYNFTWIESQRNLMPYDIGCQEDLASKGTQKVEPMRTC